MDEDSCVQPYRLWLTIVSFRVGGQLLIRCEGLRTPRVLATIRFGAWGRMCRADMFTQLMVLGESCFTIGLGALREEVSIEALL